jgi:hypothetical protein
MLFLTGAKMPWIQQRMNRAVMVMLGDARNRCIPAHRKGAQPVAHGARGGEV